MADDKKNTEGKNKALGLALEAIEKQFGKGSIMKLGENQVVKVETIPTGSISLDLALGGGLPKGRIIEVYGPESSGKTTLTLHAIAEIQKAGGTAAFIDAEHALDPTYAKKIGVDTDNLLLSQPDNGEQALEIVETLVRSNAVDLIVVDSVAALVPRAEIEGEMGDSHMGLQARLMSQALSELTGAAFILLRCAKAVSSGIASALFRSGLSRIRQPWDLGSPGKRAISTQPPSRVAARGLVPVWSGVKPIASSAASAACSWPLIAPMQNSFSVVVMMVAAGFAANRCTSSADPASITTAATPRPMILTFITAPLTYRTL